MAAEPEKDRVQENEGVGKEGIDGKYAHHIRGEVARQLESLSFTGKITSEIIGIQENLKLHHKILYAALVFFGLVLIWSGAWDLIEITPVLKKPVFALIIGVSILASTRTLYKKLAG
ncbi:MAG: hypothetical protein R6T78_03000 [Dehalococcoidales bacterium]